MVSIFKKQNAYFFKSTTALHNYLTESDAWTYSEVSKMLYLNSMRMRGRA